MQPLFGAPPRGQIDDWGVGWTSPADRVEDEPVHLRLTSARQNSNVGANTEPVITLTVMPFNTWQIVKRRVKEKWPGLKSVPDNNIRLLYKSVELRGGYMVDDYNMDGGLESRPVELQYLVIDRGHAKDHSEPQIGLYVDSQVPAAPTLKVLVGNCLAALLSGIQPQLTEEGTGATYMISDTSKRKTLAVFKPKDEEAFAPQNPRGYVGQENSVGLRQGILSTQQAAREVAAYLLDHEKFAGVPATTLVHARHPKFVKVATKHGGSKTVWKIGAFQEFCETKDTAGNFAPQVFAETDVHRIGILDVRIVNLDRNDGNLLVRRGHGGQKFQLVPIDHGLSLPDRLEVYTDDIAWMSWPQAQQPFGEKELAYIKALRGTSDSELLAQCLGIRRECLRLLEVTTKLLQIGAEHGLTLYEIGTIMYRVDRGSDVPMQHSKLEQIITTCLDTALAIAGESSVTNSSSSIVAGLDLQFPGGGQKINREASSELHIPTQPTPVATPQLIPSSPNRVPLSPGLPFHPTAPMELPPQFSLDGISESDTPKSPDFFLPMAAASALNGVDEFAKLPDQHVTTRKTTLRTSISKRLHRTSAARFASKKGEGRETNGSLFSRTNLQASDWTPALEQNFRSQVTAELTHYIKRKFERTPRDAPAGDAHSPKDETPQEEPEDLQSLASAFPSVMPSGTDTRRLAHRTTSSATEDDEVDEGKADTDEKKPEVIFSLSVSEDGNGDVRAVRDENLFGTERKPQAARSLYVPPHRRRAQLEAKETDAAGAAGASTDDGGESSAVPTAGPSSPEVMPAPSSMPSGTPEAPAPLQLPKPLYVPPQRRRAEQDAAAAAASVGNLGETESAPSKLLHLAPSSPLGSPMLPADDAGGNDRHGFCVHQGPRHSMEDAVDAIAQFDSSVPTEFYAVYDGHSGTHAVEYVRKRLPQVISGCSGFDEPGQMPEVLAEAFRLMDTELLGHLRRQPRSPPARPSEPPQHLDGEDGGSGAAEGRGGKAYVLSSGCVACVAIVRGATIHIANLGDCRALVCCNGEMTPLTVDHRAEVNESERERLCELGIEVSSDGYLHGRIGVSRAFGDWAWEFEEKCRGLVCWPEMTQSEITEDTEFLLLACDGVFEKMTTKEAGQIVRRCLRSTGEPRAAAEALIKHAKGRNGSDNLSAVVVLFRRPPQDVGRTAPRRLFMSRAKLQVAAEAATEDAAPAAATPDGGAPA